MLEKYYPGVRNIGNDGTVPVLKPNPPDLTARKTKYYQQLSLSNAIECVLFLQNPLEDIRFGIGVDWGDFGICRAFRPGSAIRQNRAGNTVITASSNAAAWE